MDVKKGELIAVVGKIGSGKSSLLSAILGEMQKVKESPVYFYWSLGSEIYLQGVSKKRNLF